MRSLNNWLIAFSLLILSSSGVQAKAPARSPRIVNIVNFIRQTEPRIPEYTDEVLYQTVVSESQCLRSHNLKGTYLLQYDALINPEYQSLMKEEASRGCDVGGWWEITEPHVKAAGLQWRGRYPWDWHTNVGFSVGYTPEEREKLADVYMEKFKEIFGTYPASVGSWFIDAHTLAYMFDKYHIQASCMCRDQVGTDGYTLWGGYLNQSYYPSRLDAYMPAQTKAGQIGVPVFRMLGSDPIYQYEAGIGGAVQSVATLEPVCQIGGGSEEWVDWFFRTLSEDPAMGFSYTQAGQENSFTWGAIRKGFEYQMDQLEKLSSEGKVEIWTLKETGKWFAGKYPVTPVTSFAAMTDSRDSGRKALWFDSRFYRAGLLWNGRRFVIRDIHLFDEKVRSPYLTESTTSTKCLYETLPLVDGCLWSTADKMAGLRLFLKDDSGAFLEAEGGSPVIAQKGKAQIVRWELADGKGAFIFRLRERSIDVKYEGRLSAGSWILKLTAQPEAQLPFTSISSRSADAVSQGVEYHAVLKKGLFQDCRPAGDEEVFNIIPAGNRILLSFD